MSAPFSFRELHILHQFHARSLAIQAGTTEEVVQSMVSGRPVGRRQAENVLAALTHRTGRTYSLANVTVPLLTDQDWEARIETIAVPYRSVPRRLTFEEVLERHTFTDLNGLAVAAQVPERIVYAMKDARPVLRDHARQVLSAFSRLVFRQYSLANVGVPTHEENFGF